MRIRIMNVWNCKYSQIFNRASNYKNSSELNSKKNPDSNRKRNPNSNRKKNLYLNRKSSALNGNKSLDRELNRKKILS